MVSTGCEFKTQENFITTTAAIMLTLFLLLVLRFFTNRSIESHFLRPEEEEIFKENRKNPE